MEIKSEFKVEFKEAFRKSLRKILDHIRKSSYQNALKFEKNIVEKIYEITENPEAFPILRKASTVRIYRYAVFKKTYEIYYFVDYQHFTLIILDIRSSRQDPNSLKSLDKI